MKNYLKLCHDVLLGHNEGGRMQGTVQAIQKIFIKENNGKENSEMQKKA